MHMMTCQVLVLGQNTRGVTVSIATADPVFWERGDFECFSGKSWEGGFIKISNESQQPMQAIGSESLF